MLNVEFSKKAKKFMKDSEKNIQKRLIEKIENLKIEPFPQDTRRVKGREEKIFRVRVGKYRIEYVLFFDKNIILISNIDKRGRIYNENWVLFLLNIPILKVYKLWKIV